MYTRTIVSLFALCAVAAAQDSTGDRIVVPARESSHARVVNCSIPNGGITVKTHAGKEVIVEDGTRHRAPTAAPAGMKRIDTAWRGLEVVEEDNVITIRNRSAAGHPVTITVPVETSLRLRSAAGAIDVDGVRGEVDVHTQNGKITLTNISGTVTADSQNGPIQVSMLNVDGGKPLTFSTFNGTVDLTFPPTFKSNLTVKTNHGPVYSDFEVTLGGAAAVAEKNGSANGRFRINIDRTIHGSINGGGPDLTIRTFNGGVYLRKQK